MIHPEILVYASIVGGVAVFCRGTSRLQTHYERLRSLPLVLLLVLFAFNGAQALYNPIFNWSVVALAFAIAAELLITRHFVAGLLCYPFSTLFYALGFQGIAWALALQHVLVALLGWLAAAAWMSHLLWTHQQRSLLAPLNLYLALDALLVVAAFSAELTLRRDVPWLLVGSFHFVLGDALLLFDEFIGHVPLASLAVPLLYYVAQITSAMGVLTLPNQGDD